MGGAGPLLPPELLDQLRKGGGHADDAKRERRRHQHAAQPALARRQLRARQRLRSGHACASGPLAHSALLQSCSASHIMAQDLMQGGSSEELHQHEECRERISAGEVAERGDDGHDRAEEGERHRHLRSQQRDCLPSRKLLHACEQMDVRMTCQSR